MDDTKIPVADAVELLGFEPSERTKIYYLRDRGLLDVREPLDGAYGRYVMRSELRRFQAAKVADLEAELARARAVLARLQ